MACASPGAVHGGRGRDAAVRETAASRVGTNAWLRPARIKPGRASAQLESYLSEGEVAPTPSGRVRRRRLRERSPTGARSTATNNRPKFSTVPAGVALRSPQSQKDLSVEGPDRTHLTRARSGIAAALDRVVPPAFPSSRSTGRRRAVWIRGCGACAGRVVEQPLEIGSGE